jgi:hypothetical protein
MVLISTIGTYTCTYVRTYVPWYNTTVVPLGTRVQYVHVCTTCTMVLRVPFGRVNVYVPWYVRTYVVRVPYHGSRNMVPLVRTIVGTMALVEYVHVYVLNTRPFWYVGRYGHS